MATVTLGLRPNLSALPVPAWVSATLPVGETGELALGCRRVQSSHLALFWSKRPLRRAIGELSFKSLTRRVPQGSTQAATGSGSLLKALLPLPTAQRALHVMVDKSQDDITGSVLCPQIDQFAQSLWVVSPIMHMRIRLQVGPQRRRRVAMLEGPIPG